MWNRSKYILIFALVFVIWVFLPEVLFKYNNLISLADKGLYGDSYGAINTLFSGFAFAGLIIAILLQREELQLQRKELHESSKALNAQVLINTYSSLLNSNNNVIEHNRGARNPNTIKMLDKLHGENQRIKDRLMKLLEENGEFFN